MDQVISKDMVGDFLSDKHRARPILSKLDNFYKFAEKNKSKFISYNQDVTQSYKIPCQNINVGVCVYNSALFATGEPKDRDREKLAIGGQELECGLNSIEDTDFKIALFHHPLSWLDTHLRP